MIRPEAKKTLYAGRIFHCKSLNEIQEFNCLAINEKGLIVHVSKDGHENVAASLGWNEAEVTTIRITNNQFLFPGFIGMLQIFSAIHILSLPRYTYSCLTIRQRGHIRQIYSSRLA